MPNKPRPENRHREVRVEDELWAAAGVAAQDAGTTRSEVMREALRQLVERHARSHYERDQFNESVCQVPSCRYMGLDHQVPHKEISGGVEFWDDSMRPGYLRHRTA